MLKKQIKKAKKKGIKSSFQLKKYIFSDVFWFSISISILFSSILFYFQVLQPKILNQISIINQNKILKLQETYNNQLNGYINTQTKILNNENIIAEKKLNLLSKNTIDCQNPSKNTQYQSLQSEVKELKEDLKLDTKIDKSTNYGYFSDDKINQIYTKYTKEYKKLLQSLNQKQTELQEYIDFKELKNQWNTKCIKLEEAVDLNTTIEEICNYKATKENSESQMIAKKEFSKLYLAEQDLCNKWASDIQTTDQKFKLLWSDIFNEIQNIDLELITKITQNEFESQSQNLKSSGLQKNIEIQSYEQSKKGIQSLWYVLDIEI
jgi:hypothetical protein